MGRMGTMFMLCWHFRKVYSPLFCSHFDKFYLVKVEYKRHFLVVIISNILRTWARDLCEVNLVINSPDSVF